MTFLFAKVKKKRLIRNQPFFRVLIFGAIIENMLNVFLQSTFSIVLLNRREIAWKFIHAISRNLKKISAIKRFVGRDWQFMAKCQAGTSSFRKCSKLATNKQGLCVFMCYKGQIMRNWLLDQKCFDTKWKTESELEISVVFYLVPKVFRSES